MNFFLPVVFYSFVSSIIFVHGIGLEYVYAHIENPRDLVSFIKNFIFIFVILSLLWPISRYVLNPIGIDFLLPVLAVFFLELLDLLFKLLLPKFSVLRPEERLFSWGLVFFCLYQAGEYKECLALIFASFVSFFIFLFILNAIRQKINIGSGLFEWKKASLLLISMGLVLSVLYFTDVSPFF